MKSTALRIVQPPDQQPTGTVSAPSGAATPGLTAPSRAGAPGRFVTDVLVELGFADHSTVTAAIERARGAGRPPEQILLESGAISADQLARALAERHGLAHIDLGAYPVDMAAANLVSAAVARRHAAVPVGFEGERAVLVAVADPANVLALDDLAIITGRQVLPAVAASADIAALISRLRRYDEEVAEAVSEDAGQEPDAGAAVTELLDAPDDAPVIRLVHSIVAQATEAGASDIHFEPEADGAMRVRFRVDGVLSASTSIPRRMVPGVVSRVKIMAELDISERRLPQDGRVGLKIDGREIDVRVVTLPSVHGESVVMRILDRDAAAIGMDHLGLPEAERERFRAAFSQAYGTVLVTGPTGSGKSTTLYAALQMLNTPERNIITIEDPVEYQLAGVTQIQVAPRAGLGFATGLRSMMRADPDIIMVGEIRDAETARIAVESALTGHLVLSTLHTNDAPTAITRLVEMGIEPFLVASAIDCVVAQRLARVLCVHCKRRTIVPADVLRSHGFAASYDIEAYEPAGCARCGQSGYRGRIGLFEVMALSERIRSLAVSRAPADEVAAVATEEGMRRLRDDGFRKVLDGVTSLAEIARVTGGAPAVTE